MSKLTVNLLLLAKMTYYIPESKFYMGSWCDINQYMHYYQVPKPNTVQDYHHCGTSACLAGWASICKVGEPNEYHSWKMYAESLVEYNASLTEYLFASLWNANSSYLRKLGFQNELDFARFRLYTALLPLIQIQPRTYTTYGSMESLAKSCHLIHILARQPKLYFDVKEIINIFETTYAVHLTLSSAEIQLINDFNPTEYITDFATTDRQLPQLTMAERSLDLPQE